MATSLVSIVYDIQESKVRRVLTWNSSQTTDAASDVTVAGTS